MFKGLKLKGLQINSHVDENGLFEIQFREAIGRISNPQMLILVTDKHGLKGIDYFFFRGVLLLFCLLPA